MRHINNLIYRCVVALDLLRGLIEPWMVLAVRLWIAMSLWKKGMDYLKDYPRAKLIYIHEYQLPFFEPESWLNFVLVVSLISPLLLLIGLGARFAALVIFFIQLAMQLYFEASLPGALLMLACLFLALRGASLYSWDYFLRSGNFEDAEDIPLVLHHAAFVLTIGLTLLAVYELAVTGLQLGTPSILAHFS